MNLLPREYDKLALHAAGSLAQKRLARGRKLNHPEAVALIATQVLEFIRDGDKSVAELMELGRHFLGKRQLLRGVPLLIESVQVEGTFRDGTKLVTVGDPFPDEDGDLEMALYGSFLPVPDLSVFDGSENEEELPSGGLPLRNKITLNEKRKAIKLRVTNTADRPVQIGSHYHFIETNPLLVFDREKAYGKRLNIIAGTAKRFEAGDTCCVTLVEIGGRKRITGGNGLASGTLDPSRLPEIMKIVIEKEFGHEKEDNALEGITGEDLEFTTMVPRDKYMDIFGVTTGDKIRLGDTCLLAEVEKDYAVYGDECKFGGGKVLREGMGQVSGYVSADVLDVVITNALVIDYTGIYKADIGIKDGRISGIGKAGNPDVMDGVNEDMVVGVNTEAIAGEGLILTAGGIDSHIHFICPQIVDEAIASGVTTLIGGGTGPAHGTLATTCTPAPEQMRTMLIATDELPLNFGFSGKGNTSEPQGLADIIEAGAICLKLHEDWGTTPAAIDTCLKVADEFDIQVTIHTDTLNESGCVEETIKAFGGRCIHTYHSEGAGGGHAPDILKVCGLLNVLPSSTDPTRPYTTNTVDEHRDMLMVCHHLDKNIPEDVKFADSRIRAQTIAAEDILHDMGAISMISSDSQAMGRIGEVITRTWQTAHKMRLQRGQLPESKGVDNDNLRIRRYIAKYTINPAIAHGISHIVGSVEMGKLADLVLWKPQFFGAKPEIVIKGGTIAWAQMGDANGSIPTPEPKRMKPMFGATGKAGSLHSLAFVSQAAAEGGVKQKYNLTKRVESVRNTRKLQKTDMKLNSATPEIMVDPTSFITTADGVELKTILGRDLVREQSSKDFPRRAMAMDLDSSSLMDLLLKSQFPETKLNGSVRVKHVLGKSSVTRSYSTYPLQLMVPKKAIPSDVDAVLVYALTFGGGIVSGDCIFFELDVDAHSTMTLLTQGFTNVYKSVEGKTSRQILKCSVGSGGLLALLPDSVVCFATAKYSQVQSFNLAPDANLVLVDWLTSGRIALGECWSFDYFRSTNHVYIQGNTPVLLDSVCLEQGLGPSISERMGDYHVIALIFIYGPRLAQIRKVLELNVQNLACGALNAPAQNASFAKGDRRPTRKWSPQQMYSTPALFASCSTVGPQEDGLVVRVASTNTRRMYRFLREQLSCLQPILGMLPYADNH